MEQNQMNVKLNQKIDSQIEGLQKKIEALSGDYLTNTYKRQQEQQARDKKIDGYQLEIDILRYLADQIELTALQGSLVAKAMRDMFHQYHAWHRKSKTPLRYPAINDDTPEWQRKELEQNIKRLQKIGVNNLDELLNAVEEYESIIDVAAKPIDNTKRMIKELTNKARLQQKGDINFTPDGVAEELVRLAKINSKSKVLEPSAGIGNIADKIKEVTDYVDVIERMSNFRELLELKGHRLIGDDFLEFESDDEYDAVIANPPFSNNQDIDHVRKMYEHVKDGGILVSIMSPHWTFAKDKKSVAFRDWIHRKKCMLAKLKSGTFEATGVSSEIVVIYKENQNEIKEV